MTAREQMRPTIPGDEGRMKLLWKTCFGDEDRYIDGFFAGGYVPGQGLVLESGGEIASMLLPFSQEIVGPDGTAVPIWYVYAFCTHPACQGRGFGRRLLAWTEQQAARQGKQGVVMVPGERSLFEFYGTLGYQTGFSTWERVISRENPAEQLPQVTPCALEKYQQLRAQWLRDRWWIRYPERSGAWQARLCQNSGGGLYRIGNGIAAVECWDGAVAVKELLSDGPEQATQALLAHLGAKQALVRGPVPAKRAAGQRKPFGVVKWLDPAAQAWWQGEENGYLAFAFD